MGVSIKSAEDIVCMRLAGRLASEVLDHIAPQVAAGITTGELDEIATATGGQKYVVNDPNEILGILASALLNTGQQLGGAVGLSVLGTLAAHSRTSRMLEFTSHPASTASAQGVNSIQHQIFVAGQSAAAYGGVVAMGLGFLFSAVHGRWRRCRFCWVSARAWDSRYR